MKKIILLLSLIALNSYAEEKKTNINVNATLKYNYSINTINQTTTSKYQNVIYKVTVKDNYIEYYY